MVAVCVCAVAILSLIPAGVAMAASPESAFTYTVADGEATITSYDWETYGGDMVIPATLGGYPVVAIGDHAFSNDWVNTVETPASLETIGANAFYGCYLQSVTLNEGLQSIENSGFYNNPGLVTVDIPATVTSIGSWAFNTCPDLESAYFFGNAPTMGDYVFYGAASAFAVYFVEGSTGFTAPPGPWSPTGFGSYPTAYFVPSDRIPPVIASVAIDPASPYVGQAITLSASASDNLGVAKVEYKLGSAGTWTEMTLDSGAYVASLAGQAAGTYAVYVRATDAAGNVSSASSRSFTVVKHTYATNVVFTAAPTSVVVKTAYTVEGRVDPAGTVGSVSVTFSQQKGKSWRVVKTETVALTDGSFLYSWTPTAKGTWRIVVSYPQTESASAVYQASSFSQDFRVVAGR
jgi:hypothetical protein